MFESALCRAESDYYRAESYCRRAESDYHRAESDYHRAESDFHRAESVFKEQNRWGSLDLTLVEQTPTSVEQTKFSPLYFVEQIQAMVVKQNHTIA